LRQDFILRQAIICPPRCEVKLCRILRPHPEEPAAGGRLEGWRRTRPV